jgi:hypothetical protein
MRVDYTSVFDSVPIPDEAYFGTALSMVGYPIEDRVVRENVTWARWEEGHGSPREFCDIDYMMVRDIAASGSWFARKFDSRSNVGGWGMHRAWSTPSRFSGKGCSSGVARAL